MSPLEPQGALLRSRLIPAEFAHGFPTREPALLPEPLYRVRQVHGNRAIEITAASDREQLASIEADALYTNVSGAALAISTADCVPILLAEPQTGVCAAIHAGWRGTVAGIAAAVVNTIRARFGVDSKSLFAALGPSIGPCCFEVGDEVAQKFARDLVREGASKNGKPTVDLWEANRQQLIASGLQNERIDAKPPCTYCDARFFSYRRDAGKTGRQLSFIVRSP